jgi:hypothetical protein
VPVVPPSFWLNTLPWLVEFIIIRPHARGPYGAEFIINCVALSHCKTGRKVCCSHRPERRGNSHLASMADGEHFIKGYKVDHDKLRNRYGSRKSDPENARFLSIWQKFPHPFLYLANGEEPEGHVSLVLVLAEGHNKEELEQTPIPVISEPYTTVFTAGIWVKYS